MAYFNDLLRHGLYTGEYFCSQCGELMQFEDEETRDILICLKCGHSVDLDDYGSEEDFYDIIPNKEKTNEMVLEDDFEYDDD